MKKSVFLRIMLVLFACAFVFCVAVVFFFRSGYIANEWLNRKTSESFTVQTTSRPTADAEEEAVEEAVEEAGPIIAPIQVDFAALKKINRQIVGWIYCEDTRIDYPVVLGDDNDFYIDHAYNLDGSPSGAIFVDYQNREGFEDSNTIIYGHHMADGSMFATLEKWIKQEYFDEHPVMWLLTPEQDYRVDLFSAYYISALDEVYSIYREPSMAMDNYLATAKEHSEVEADVELDGNARYVMLSTCAYVFSLARAVIHGKLVPVDSIGGKPFDPNIEAPSPTPISPSP